MTTKQKSILKTLFQRTNGKVSTTLFPNEISQHKRFYERIRTLEQEGYLIVFRSKGEPSKYLLTDKGIITLMLIYPEQELFI